MRGSTEKSIAIGRRLAHRALDTAVRKGALYLKAGWAPPCKVTFSMEALEYADFGAAARFVVFAEGLVRHGFEIEIVLPNPEMRPSEHEFLSSTLPTLPASQQEGLRRGLYDRIRQRRRLRGFLGQVGFFRALQFPHLPKGVQEFCKVFDRGKYSSASELAPEMLGSPVREYPAIVPFRWLDALNSSQTHRWQEETIRVLFDHGLVMTRNHAESLVMTVFHELIENVKEHASDKSASAPPGALFGAITLNRERAPYQPKTDDFYSSATPYLDWVGTQRSPIVRVVVADSGLGLPATILPLMPENKTLSSSARNLSAIEYSFRPTVSQLGPGLRRGVGLTTVRRFVRSYFGMITLRARNVCGGFEFRTRPPVPIQDPSLPYVPGTSIEVLLGLTLGTRLESERKGQVEDRAGNIVTVQASFDDELDQLYAAIDSSIDEKAAPLPIAVLMFDNWKRDRRSAQEFALKLRRLAEKLSGLAGIAVVLAGASDSDCEATFGVMDEILESSAPTLRDQWKAPSWSPPFLIFSATGTPRWAGGSSALRGLLYKMLDGEIVRIERATVPGLTSDDVGYLRVERDWFQLRENEMLGLSVAPAQIDRAIAAYVADKLLLRIDEARRVSAGS